MVYENENFTNERLTEIIEIAREKNQAITIEFQTRDIARVIVHRIGEKNVTFAIDAPKEISIKHDPYTDLSGIDHSKIYNK